MAAFSPSWASEITTLAPRRPRRARERHGAQEFDPEWLGLAVAHGHARSLAATIGVDADGHDDRQGHDVMVSADFYVGGIQPDVGPIAFYRPGGYDNGLWPICADEFWPSFRSMIA